MILPYTSTDSFKTLPRYKAILVDEQLFAVVGKRDNMCFPDKRMTYRNNKSVQRAGMQKTK